MGLSRSSRESSLPIFIINPREQELKLNPTVPVKNGSALWFTRVKNFLRNNAAAVITFDLLVVNT